MNRSLVPCQCLTSWTRIADTICHTVGTVPEWQIASPLPLKELGRALHRHSPIHHCSRGDRGIDWFWGHKRRQLRISWAVRACLRGNKCHDEGEIELTQCKGTDLIGVVVCCCLSLTVINFFLWYRAYKPRFFSSARLVYSNRSCALIVWMPGRPLVDVGESSDFAVIAPSWYIALLPLLPLRKCQTGCVAQHYARVFCKCIHNINTWSQCLTQQIK